MYIILVSYRLGVLPFAIVYAFIVRAVKLLSDYNSVTVQLIWLCLHSRFSSLQAHLSMIERVMSL